MRILITGAAGFIGGNLSYFLKAKGVEVCGVDNFSNYYSPEMKKTRIQALNIDSILVNIDIRDLESLRVLFAKFQPTHVIHLAAQGGVRASKTDPLPYLESNQVGFLNILQLAEIFQAEKFIYASSSSVYGEGLAPPFKESDVLSSPKSLYALSKLSNELVAKHLPSSKTERIGLRFFTVYGPWGRPDMAVFRLLASSILGKTFTLTANQDVVRDFTYVDDVTRVIIELINSKSTNQHSQIFNIAGGNPFSLAQLFSIMENLGIDVEMVAKKQDELDVNITHGSTEKLANSGFYVPATTLKLGVERTWEWITSQKKEKLSEWLDYQK